MVSDILVQLQLQSTRLILHISSRIWSLSSHRVKFVILRDFLMTLVIWTPMQSGGCVTFAAHILRCMRTQSEPDREKNISFLLWNAPGGFYAGDLLRPWLYIRVIVLREDSVKMPNSFHIVLLSLFLVAANL